MAENLRVFNAHKFCSKMNARGYDCIVHTIKGTYRYGALKGKTWEKDTVYMKKKDGNFLEYAGTTTGSWFRVGNQVLLKKLKGY